MLSRAGIPWYHLGSRRPHGRRLWGYNRTLCAITGASGPVYISSTRAAPGPSSAPVRTPSHQPGLSDRDKRAYSSHPRQFHHDSKNQYHVFPDCQRNCGTFQGNSIYLFCVSLYHPGPDGALGPGLWSCRGGNRGNMLRLGRRSKEFLQGPMVHRLMIQGKTLPQKAGEPPKHPFSKHKRAVATGIRGPGPPQT